jgi:hypothetical protein
VDGVIRAKRLILTDEVSENDNINTLVNNIQAVTTKTFSFAGNAPTNSSAPWTYEVDIGSLEDGLWGFTLTNSSTEQADGYTMKDFGAAGSVFMRGTRMAGMHQAHAYGVTIDCCYCYGTRTKSYRQDVHQCGYCAW